MPTFHSVILAGVYDIKNLKSRIRSEDGDRFSTTWITRLLNQFIKNGSLDMDLVIEKFVLHYTAVYGNENSKFVEEDGRKHFLLYLRPIINGRGNYYVEAQTRDSRRTDVIVDYKGEQFIIELKLWYGDAYHREGEQQLSEYLDTYGLKKGYMVVFNFNQKKQTGVKVVYYGDKVLVEGMV